jgi:hypothetical protein
MDARGWVVQSHVDGWIDIQVPTGAASASAFAKEVRGEVERMGYAPTIAMGAGGQFVRVRTAETLEQAGRGEHRA